MTDMIRSVLEKIDPDNALLLVQPPVIGVPSDFANKPTLANMLKIPESEEKKPSTESKKRKSEVSVSSRSAKKQQHEPRNRKFTAETVAEGNPNGSTFRNLRKRMSRSPALIAAKAADLELQRCVGDQDDDCNRLSKRELAHRLFEATRFRKLLQGDYVAAKIGSKDMWLLCRVVKPWEALPVPIMRMMELTAIKRDALFKEKVVLQEDCGDGARQVPRQHVLPLPRSFEEAYVWISRIRKGTRVYAMYPDTTVLYPATVVDANTYCRKQDDIVVVKFDEDKDDDGVTPHRHTLSRFVSPIPREYQRKNK